MVLMGWQKVSVFISSTFNDMHSERDYLVKYVFPELAQWCEERRLQLVDIDLRWGVTNADSTARNTIYACLKGVDSSRPFFLCFLGQRRGWVPTLKEISALTTEAYPQSGELIGSHSATEIEIEHALLYPMYSILDGSVVKHESNAHAVFLIRKDPFIECKQQLSPELRRIYTNAAADDPNNENLLLEKTKRQVRGQCGKVYDYTCTWRPDVFSPELQREAEGSAQGRLTDFEVNGEPLSRFLIATLKQEIAGAFPDHKPFFRESPAEIAAGQQVLFLETSAEAFLWRDGDFDKLDEYVWGKNDNAFLLSGLAGQGKSTLLAKYVQKLRSQDVRVYVRFGGVSDDVADIYQLLCSLLRETDMEPLPNPAELRQKLPEYLTRFQGVIVIDAIDQIAGGMELISWLPKTLPAGLKLILSVKRWEGTQAMLDAFKRDGSVTLTEVKPFEAESDRKRFIDVYLSQYLKQLDDENIKEICKADASQNPLFLKVLLSELRVFGEHKRLAERINAFGESPEDAFGELFKRLESDIAYLRVPPNLAVPAIFGLLASARGGLTELELLNALGIILQHEQMDTLRDAVRFYLRQTRLYIARRDGRSDFLFDSFRSAALKRYRQKASDYHRALNRMFLAVADPDGSRNYGGQDARAMRELGYHAVQADAEQGTAIYKELRYLQARCALGGGRHVDCGCAGLAVSGSEHRAD